VRAGVRRLDTPVRALRVLKTVEVADGDAWARLEPAETLEIDFRIDFPTPPSGGRKSVSIWPMAPSCANSATAAPLAGWPMWKLLAWRNGLALGGSLENAIVVDGGRILNPEGLRHADEPVRHKMLDALGDLALAGAPILGRYTGHRSPAMR
jgi:UDP-3-O-[3-hydroxymyristoyl] N-acetylglucosamine deacetylase